MAKSRVSAVALGRHLDVSSQWIGKLVKAGVLVKLSDGTFDLDRCRVQYIRHLRDGRGEKSDATARAQEARGRRLELQLQREAGELIGVPDTEEAVGEIVAAFNAELIGIPAACTRDIELRKFIEDRVNEAITRCQQRLDQAIAALASGEDALGDDAENDA